MPNWCEGTVGIRGRTDDILKFLNEEFVRYTYDVEKHESVEVPGSVFKIDDDSDMTIWLTVDDVAGTWIWIKDTQLAFFDDDQNVNDFVMDKDKSSDIWTLRLPIKQAWSFREDDWMALSSKYHLDFNLFGVECGMEFMMEFQIVNGEYVEGKLTNTKTGNWSWDCPFPWMGG